MKYLKFYLLIALIANFSCDRGQTGEKTGEVFSPESFEIQRGVNISHWLSQSDRRGEERREFFTEEDVDLIAGFGYDHIRIPIDEEQMWDEAGNKESEAFELLHNGIQWARQHKLRVVVDLHILRSHHFNADSIPLWTDPHAQAGFLDLWRDLSGELIEYPNGLVAYELMNEPVTEDPEDWNHLVERALSVVRENEQERIIVIGSNRWQSVHTFDELRVPKNDPNIMLSFHFYIPFLLTHHEASWTDIEEYTGPVYYPGLIVRDEDIEDLEEPIYSRIKEDQQYYTRDTLETLMMKPIRKAEALELPLYCGEWGCYPTMADSTRYRWYEDVRYCLEKHDIAWANWDYKGGFGIVDRNREPQEELIGILVGSND